MKQKIYSCSISLLLCLLPLLTLHAQHGEATGNGKNPPQAPKEKSADEGPYYPLYNGISVGVDLWGIGGKALGSDYLSSEVSVDVNLKNRFFPTLEVGYGHTDAWNEQGTNYKTGAPFFRIGMDYNALYKKEHGHMMLVGVRYARSDFKYDIHALGVEDPVYGGMVGNPNLEDEIWKGSLPFNHTGMKGSMQWLEICLGIRAHIWKSLYMGWALRMRYKLSASNAEYGNPWYVPGYGKYSSNTMGVTYTITYKLPF